MEDTEMLKEEIKKYVEKKGWPGFFGLLATISPEKVDKDDLEEYSVIQKTTAPTEIPNYETYNTPITEKEAVQELSDLNPAAASIYAREHLEAVQEDLMDTMPNQMMGEDMHKARILANPSIPAQAVREEKAVTPNPWGDAKTVEPGEVMNMLTR